MNFWYLLDGMEGRCPDFEKLIYTQVDAWAHK